MAIQSGGYQGARSCTSGPQPGAWGYMDWFLNAYADDGAVNSGIYNCRSVRGGSTTSLHGEGRACDFGIRPYSASYGTRLADFLKDHSKELGIQCVIWNRRIWSSSYPNAGWRKYSGVNPHVDHLHVELMWWAANQTRDDARELINSIARGDTTPAPAPAPKPDPTPEGLFGMSLYDQKTRTKKLRLPKAKWKSIPIDDTGSNFSILSGIKPGQDIMALATIGLTGLPVGANARVRFYLVSYKKGTKTKRLSSHYSSEIVGTAGVSYGQIMHLRKNSFRDGDRSIRLRAEIIVFQDGIDLTFAQFNRGKA